MAERSEYWNWVVPLLRQECQRRELDQVGSKRDLVLRLSAADEAAAEDEETSMEEVEEEADAELASPAAAFDPYGSPASADPYGGCEFSEADAEAVVAAPEEQEFSVVDEGFESEDGEFVADAPLAEGEVEEVGASELAAIAEVEAIAQVEAEAAALQAEIDQTMAETAGFEDAAPNEVEGNMFFENQADAVEAAEFAEAGEAVDAAEAGDAKAGGAPSGSSLISFGWKAPVAEAPAVAAASQPPAAKVAETIEIDDSEDGDDAASNCSAATDAGGDAASKGSDDDREADLDAAMDAALHEAPPAPPVPDEDVPPIEVVPPPSARAPPRKIQLKVEIPRPSKAPRLLPPPPVPAAPRLLHPPPPVPGSNGHFPASATAVDAAECQAAFNELPPPAVSLNLQARQLRALLVDRICPDHDMEYAALIGRLRAQLPPPPAAAEGSTASASSGAAVPPQVSTSSGSSGTVVAASAQEALADARSRSAAEALKKLAEARSSTTARKKRPHSPGPPGNLDFAAGPPGNLSAAVASGASPHPSASAFRKRPSLAAEGNAVHSEEASRSDAPMPAEYNCATAPLALLRMYAAQERWFCLNDGHIIFEDDSVQFPGSTLTPVREHPWDSAPLNLVSLWLLVALRGRYESVTSSVLKKHGATRIDHKYVPRLLRFLRSEESECELLMSKAELSRLPQPTPKRLPHRQNVSVDPLKHKTKSKACPSFSSPKAILPGANSKASASTLSSRLLVRKPKSKAPFSVVPQGRKAPGLAPPKAAAPAVPAKPGATAVKSKPGAAPVLSKAGSMPMPAKAEGAAAATSPAVPKLMAERLERLRTDCHALIKGAPAESRTPAAVVETVGGASNESVAMPSSPCSPPSKAARSGSNGEVALLRRECLQFAKHDAQAQVADRHLHDQERFLSRKLEEIGDSIAATNRRLAAAATRRRQLRESFKELQTKLTPERAFIAS